MKRMFKRSMMVIASLMMGLFLIACGGTNTPSNSSEELKNAVSNLTASVILGDNESLDKVTSDLTLISTDGEVSIAWSTNNPATVAISGKVTRQTIDVNVELTAMLSHDSQSDQVKFNVVVLAKEGVVEPEEPIVPAKDFSIPDVDGVTPIADFLNQEEGTTAKIVGLITSIAPYNSFSLEDETGAIALRVGGANATNVPFKVGDVVEATVELKTFNGLTQGEISVDDLSNEALFKVHTGDFGQVSIVNLNVVGLNVGDLFEYQSKTVNLPNATVVSTSVDDFGSINIELEKNGETIVARWDNRTKGVDNSLMLSLKSGDVVSIVEATLSWYNDPQIAIGRTSELVLGEATTPEEPVDPVDPVDPEEPTDPITDGKLVHFDFTKTDLGVSYSSNNETPRVIENLINNKNINVISTRVAANTNTKFSNQFLLMSASTKDGLLHASIEFDLGTVVSSMTADAAFWSEYDASEVTKLELQAKVNDEWVLVQDLKALINNSLEYVNITVTDINASKVRLYAEGTAPGGTGNNGARILFDNMIFYGEGSDTPVDPVDPDKETYIVKFDTDGGSLVNQQTVVEGGFITEPSNPTKSGYTFKEWTLEGVPFNFSNEVTKDITLVATWEVKEAPVPGDSQTGTIQYTGDQVDVDIPSGDITNLLTVSEDVIAVTYTEGTSNNTIINNSSQEIRLYIDGMITISVDNAVITSVTIETSRNNGALINGVSTMDALIEQTFTEGLPSLSIQANGAQLRIVSITIIYTINN